MKTKIYIYIILLVILSMLTPKIYAEDTISFSCKYKTTGLDNYKVSEFTLKFTDLPINYIKDGGDGYINSWSEINNYITMDYVVNGNNKSVGPKKNKSLCGEKICWFNNKATYLSALASSYEQNDHKGFYCPQLWLTNVNQVGTGLESNYNITLSAKSTYMTTTGEMIPTTMSYTVDNYPTTLVTTDIIKMENYYDNPDKMECVYYGDQEGTIYNSYQYRLIYDKTADKLYFNGMGTYYLETDDNGTGKSEDIEITSGSIKDSFKGKTSCPSKVNCSCKEKGFSVTTPNLICKFADGTEFNNSCGNMKKDNGTTVYTPGTAAEIKDPEIPEGNISSCSELLGSNLTAIVKVSITILQIAGAIIAIIKGMMILIPPILAKDADALKKVSKKLIAMAIILVVIFLFRPLLQFIGNILDFDTSCII